MTELYLLEKSHEGELMRENIRSLLLSSDYRNVQLALQLIEGGGFHPSFLVPMLVAIAERIWQDDEARECVVFLRNKLKMRKKRLQCLHEFAVFFRDWHILAKNLAMASKQDDFELKVFWKEMVIQGFLRSGKGGGVCYKYQLLPSTQIFDRLTAFGSLDLSAFELEDLPTALANLPVKRINVPDSTFTKLSSPPVWQNTYVREVFVPDNIKPSPLRKLCAYFPNWKDTYFYSKGYELARADGVQAQRNNDMEKARMYAEQAIVFLRHISEAKRDFDYYHARAHAYHYAGRYDMALYCYHYIKTQYPIEEYKDCLYDMACSYACLRNKPQMLDKLAKYMMHYTHDMAEFLLKDYDMVAYHQDEDVLAMIEAHTQLPTQRFQTYAKRFLLA